MRVTYEEHGDIKTEDIDEYGDKIMSNRRDTKSWRGLQ